MSHQPSVVEFFSSRKRPAVDDLKKVGNPNKVLVLENAAPTLERPVQEDKHFGKKLVYTSKGGGSTSLAKKPSKSSTSKSSKTLKKGSKPDGSQPDIRKTLFPSSSKKPDEKKDDASKESETDSKRKIGAHVPFLFQGSLSPAKQKKPSGHLLEITESKEKVSDQQLEKKENETETKPELKTPDASTSNSRKELNLGNLKAMMSRSSRLEEMKAALKRFNEKKAQLEEKQDDKLDEPEMPVELQVPQASPMKTPKKTLYTSPQRKMTPCSLFATPPRPVPASPLKSPLKSPAFQRYQALITEGRPALILPFKYRALAELFRSIDTVAAMMHNRRETITLSLLKPGVQEISRKNLTEYQLGQIKTVFPNSFDFRIEKMRALGSQEKYELVITPLLDDFLPTVEDDKPAPEGKRQLMSPGVLMKRQRTLYAALLELTKDHHEEFLSTLEVPMCIPRFRLTRWHPEFPVDDVPDIVSTALPQPPNLDKVTSARDVLERARNLFMVNPRMERALQRVSENSAPTLSAPAAPTSDPAPPPVSAASTPNFKNALQNVPASLLEKVRAKQAARALEAMTRTPAQAKEAVRLTRLPEMARIVRNLFVSEKKGVLTREQVLRKLGDSYRESLTTSDLDDHLKLLADKTCGWITFCNVRKTDYVKLSRSVDMIKLMTRLEALAEDKAI